MSPFLITIIYEKDSILHTMSSFKVELKYSGFVKICYFVLARRIVALNIYLHTNSYKQTPKLKNKNNKDF